MTLAQEHSTPDRKSDMMLHAAPALTFTPDDKSVSRPAFFSPRPASPLEHALLLESFDPRPGMDALQAVIDELPDEIAIADASWNLLAVNQAWTVKACESPRRELRPGCNYRELLESWAADGNPDCRKVADALREMSAGTRLVLEHDYSQDVSGRNRDYRVRISFFYTGSTRLATITRHEMSDLARLARQNRRLEKSLLSVQEEERRRIGRELHDATAQLLVGLHLTNLRLKRMHRDPESTALLAEVDETLGRVNEEIRAISYLLHPPTLDARGLVASIDAMARGFARRTGLDIGFWFDGQAADWDMVIQATLYRVAQEALTNVHRHAEAGHVCIRLVAKPARFLHLIVEDDGIGIPEAPLSSLAPLGVGIAGMQSRVAELGGRLTFHRMEKGTCLIASVPLSRALIPGTGLIA